MGRFTNPASRFAHRLSPSARGVYTFADPTRLFGEAHLLARSAESLTELDHMDRAIDGALEIPTILFKAKTALDAAALVAHSLRA